MLWWLIVSLDRLEMVTMFGYSQRNSALETNWTGFGIISYPPLLLGVDLLRMTITKLTFFYRRRLLGMRLHTLSYMYICTQHRSESKSSRREPIHGGRTPSGPLSSTAQRLLMEFGLRYGVVS